MSGESGIVEDILFTVALICHYFPDRFPMRIEPQDEVFFKQLYLLLYSVDIFLFVLLKVGYSQEDVGRSSIQCQIFIGICTPIDGPGKVLIKADLLYLPIISHVDKTKCA